LSIYIQEGPGEYTHNFSSADVVSFVALTEVNTEILSSSAGVSVAKKVKTCFLYDLAKQSEKLIEHLVENRWREALVSYLHYMEESISSDLPDDLDQLSRELKHKLSDALSLILFMVYIAITEEDKPLKIMNALGIEVEVFDTPTKSTKHPSTADSKRNYAKLLKLQNDPQGLADRIMDVLNKVTITSRRPST